jgi:hypothetical protein
VVRQLVVGKRGARNDVRSHRRTVSMWSVASFAAALLVCVALIVISLAAPPAQRAVPGCLGAPSARMHDPRAFVHRTMVSIRRRDRYLGLMDPVPRIWCHTTEDHA